MSIRKPLWRLRNETVPAMPYAHYMEMLSLMRSSASVGPQTLPEHKSGVAQVPSVLPKVSSGLAVEEYKEPEKVRPGEREQKIQNESIVPGTEKTQEQSTLLSTPGGAT